MPTLPLPFTPPFARQIGKTNFSFATQNGQTVYFHYLDPIDSHDQNDRQARLLLIAKFADRGIQQKALAEAFDIDPVTVRRALAKLRQRGAGAFFEKRRSRGPSAAVKEKMGQAERLLAKGMSGAAVARQLGLTTSTVNYNRRKGVIGNGRPASSEP